MSHQKFLVAALCAATAFGQSFPADDECSTTSTVLVDGINPAPAASGLTFTNVGATTSAGAMCSTFNADVWFLYVASNSGNHVFETCTPAGFAAGTMNDTVLAVYDTCGGTALACNDDTCGLRSSVTVALNAGTIYFVRVGEFGTATAGQTTFYVTVTPPPPPITNDECGTATIVVDGPNVGLSNSGATASADAASCATFQNDVWFVYVATFTGNAVFTTGCAAGTLDTVMAVYDNCGGLELGCNDNTPGCAAGGSQVTAAVVAGNPYFVRVGTLSGTLFGSFALSIAAAPANDECASATPVVLGANGPFSNLGASNSAQPAAICGLGGNKNDVWYSFTATCPGVHNVSTGCLGFDTVLSIYDACGGLELACNDDSAGCGIGGSTASFTPTVGNTYLFRVASYTQGSSGSFTLTVSAGGAFALTFTAPLGPGSVQADFTGGAPFGGYVFALTLTAGTFPNGWLGGLDITLGELFLEIQTGFPFIGSLGACGETTIGPFAGLPSGLPLYGGGFSMNYLFGNVTAIAPAVAFTIP